MRLVHLYPDLMSVYGDRGNVLALARRAEWRGIELQVQELTLGDSLDPQDADLIFFGGGQDREQAVVSPDFLAQKGQAVREAVENGAALLSVCGGYQLLGRSYTTVDGQELPGAGLFDVRSVPGPKRHIGNVLVETELDGQRRTLVGFENHSGRTYLGPGLAGPRSHGGGRRQQRRGSERGRRLQERDWLLPARLAAAQESLARRSPARGCRVRHRTGEPAQLEPLDDRIENEAHTAVEARIRASNGRVKSGLW